MDEEKVRIDFMPYTERTVQSYGVVIDDLHYFADVLRPWVNAPDPSHPKSKRLFKFKRDPHDISRLPALNALLFRAVYFADDSGETVNFLYLFKKMDDGSWKIAQFEKGN